MPYSESWPRFESELPPEELSLLLEEEELPEAVEPVDFPLLLSVDLPSFFDDEPDFACVEDDLDPEAEGLLLLSFLDDDEVEPEVDPKVDPDVDPEGELELESLFAPNPLVLPDDEDDELGLLNELPD